VDRRFTWWPPGPSVNPTAALPYERPWDAECCLPIWRGVSERERARMFGARGAGLADLMDMGLVRSVGVSNHNVQQMRTAHGILKERGVPLAFNQLQYR
jgi:hypothetical protein